jgi:hypothetical protein
MDKRCDFVWSLQALSRWIELDVVTENIIDVPLSCEPDQNSNVEIADRRFHTGAVGASKFDAAAEWSKLSGLELPCWACEWSKI